MTRKPKARPKHRRSKSRHAKLRRGSCRAIIWQVWAGLRHWVPRVICGAGAVMMIWLAAYAFVPVPTTFYMMSESRRLGGVERQWVGLQDISPHLRRAVVAAEDAHFCRHWGLDVNAIRAAFADGARRGGSSLTQQTVKNAYLWHGRSWLRKGIEAVLAIGVDFLWSKSRILEVYLNIAEFGPGLFGAEAAAQHYFNRPAADLTLQQAAALASVLPAPQVRSPVDLSPRQRTRAARIADGAQTILNDGRAACFAD